MNEIHITTARCILRKPRIQDASAIFTNYAQDDEVIRYLTWRRHDDLESTRRFVEYCIEQYRTGNSQPLVIESRSEGEAIGMIDVRYAGHRANLGYVLARRYWGSGYMTEACQALVGHLMANGKTTRVEATCDVDNAASIALLERIGMKREGLLRSYMVHPNLSANPRDVFMYAVLQKDADAICGQPREE